jgi:hypothetical protein
VLQSDEGALTPVDNSACRFSEGEIKLQSSIEMLDRMGQPAWLRVLRRHSATVWANRKNFSLATVQNRGFLLYPGGAAAIHGNRVEPPACPRSAAQIRRSAQPALRA